ncbi:MAG: palindromic element RPE2 domain-containing protein [Rickettsia endosymbiont of Platyusa sonomae]|nr:palindromic element RPE2 domain-containing protein [Rickettsia endosymbiont of Platyusa sonomae]
MSVFLNLSEKIVLILTGYVIFYYLAYFFDSDSYYVFVVLDIVNSGEFGARSDGATPISNRRATSDNVPNFS